VCICGEMHGRCIVFENYTSAAVAAVVFSYKCRQYVGRVSMQEVMEVKKDKEQADAVRAMKQAWEEAEPGRAAKAKQSRLNYLSTHVVKVCCLNV